MKKLVLLFVSLLSLNVFAISYIVDYEVTGTETSWSGEFSVPSQTT